MAVNGDPIAALFVDGNEIDRAQLAEALHSYIAIDKNTGRLRLLPAFESLDSRRRVLALLLGYKAAYLADACDDPSVFPKVLTDLYGIPGGTARPALGELAKKRLITRTEDGRYSVEDHQVHNAAEHLKVRKSR